MGAKNRKRQKQSAAAGVGIGVDSYGGQVVDPTKNVQALVKAGFKTVRDLRKADNRYYDQVMKDHHAYNALGRKYLAQMAELRASNAALLRTSDLAAAAQTRLVDVQASNASAAQLATAVVALQTATDRNAETSRTTAAANAAALAKQVTDSAAGIQAQTNAANLAMETRVAQLEKLSAQGTGRQSVEDPQMALLIKNMQALITAQATGGGATQATREVKDDTTKLVTLVISTILAVVGVGLTIYSSTHNTNPVVVAAPPSAPAGPPQIIYLQPPPAQPQNPPK